MDLKRYDTDYGWHEMVESPDGCYYDADEADREIRRQKRKRCLAQAEFALKNARRFEKIEAFATRHGLNSAVRQRKWKERMYRRWTKCLELADKFKE